MCSPVLYNVYQSNNAVKYKTMWRGHLFLELFLHIVHQEGHLVFVVVLSLCSVFLCRIIGEIGAGPHLLENKFSCVSKYLLPIFYILVLSHC